MKQFWKLREPREKILILIAGGLSFVVLVWFGVAAPLYQANMNAHRDLRQAIADRELIERSLAGVTSRGPTAIGAATDFDTFRADVTRSAQQNGLAISRLQGNADGSLQLVISDALPSDIFLWLEEISTFPGGEPVRANLSVRDDKLQAVIDLQGTRP
jgi:type II secretory pathway component PulM